MLRLDRVHSEGFSTTLRPLIPCLVSIMGPCCGTIRSISRLSTRDIHALIALFEAM